MKKLIIIIQLSVYFLGFTLHMNALSISDWMTLSDQTWEKYKSNYIYCGENCMNNAGLVFDPLSNYHAVSEGIGYGLLLSTLFDDQQTFDVIYAAANRFLYDETTGLHHWRINNQGEIVGFGSATDAEFDIATALIIADDYVRQGRWQQPIAVDYAYEARALLEAVWTLEVVDGKYIKPGDRFQGNGRDIVNLSYFSPAWFRLYDTFLGEVRWTNLIESGYEALNSTQGSVLGLAPDWSTIEGEPAYDYCDRYGRSRDVCGYEMRYDAIRVPWRIGLDCILYGDERACQWSLRSATFLNEQPESNFARLYNMKGEIVVEYRDEAMLGMWLFSALASNDKDLKTRIEWNIYNLATQDPSHIWTNREPYYYNQSLVLFAMSYLANRSILPPNLES